MWWALSSEGCPCCERKTVRLVWPVARDYVHRRPGPSSVAVREKVVESGECLNCGAILQRPKSDHSTIWEVASPETGEFALSDENDW